MAGPAEGRVPAIHVLFAGRNEDVDARDERRHDGREGKSVAG
jgi:hypothetical protein